MWKTYSPHSVAASTILTDGCLLTAGGSWVSGKVGGGPAAASIAGGSSNEDGDSVLSGDVTDFGGVITGVVTSRWSVNGADGCTAGSPSPSASLNPVIVHSIRYINIMPLCCTYSTSNSIPCIQNLKHLNNRNISKQKYRICQTEGNLIKSVHIVRLQRIWFLTNF